MQNLHVAVARPHYVHRNETHDKTHTPRPPKMKREQKGVAAKTVQVGGRQAGEEEREQEARRVRELKAWLLGLLSEAQANWEEQLAARRSWVMMMRQDHRQKLMLMLQYIQALRKQAYEQFKHVCSKSRDENCTDCHRRALFFNQQVRKYLASDPSAPANGKENLPGKGEGIGSKRGTLGSGSQRASIDMAVKSQKNRGSQISHRMSTGQDQSSNTTQDFFIENDKAKIKKPHSKFKRTDNERTSNRNSAEKRASRDLKPHTSEEREGNEYRLSQFKRQESNEGKDSRSRTRKPSQIPKGLEETNSRKNFETKGEDSLSRRDSKSSLRQSIVRQSGRSPFQEEFLRGQFKAIDAEEAVGGSRTVGGHAGRYGRLGLQRNSTSQPVEEVPTDRRLQKKKQTKARRRYIKKNSSGNNDIDIDITSSEGDDNLMQRERSEIEEILREKEYFRDDHYKKVSRYRRERMIYDILKKEILVNEQGIQEAPEVEAEEHRDARYSQISSSNNDLALSRQHDHLAIGQKPRLKKYSLMERKESLISKLALLNQQGNSFDSIRGKIEQILNERGKLSGSGREQKGVGKNAVQKFLSEVLKITDLKRLMKEKFFKEADWSPKMREMHQFYTYLEYSMEAFRSKLNKTAESGWKELTYEGRLAETQLDGLVLDHQMRDWEGLELGSLGEENHREIECSMKYYGIDVKRLKNLNQISYEVAANKTLNPLFSSVGQRSMKEIQEIPEGLFSFS